VGWTPFGWKTQPERRKTMLNKVQLIGHLGKDPELRYTSSGIAVATFSLATSEKRKKDGETITKTEWHNIVTWRSLAELCEKYLKKGRLVFIEGKIQTRSYDDRDNNKRYITEIVADNVKFLEKNSSQHSEPSIPQPPQHQGDNWEEDDIPF
jgi:single-strand DNA-binding protein